VRVVSVLGCTVRKLGPRARSTTATTTFELLGVVEDDPVDLRPPVGDRDETHLRVLRPSPPSVLGRTIREGGGADGLLARSAA
jgi:hypothetical protein